MVCKIVFCSELPDIPDKAGRVTTRRAQTIAKCYAFHANANSDFKTYSGGASYWDKFGAWVALNVLDDLLFNWFKNRLSWHLKNNLRTFSNKSSNLEAQYWIPKQSKAIFDHSFPKSERILIKFGIKELKEQNERKKQKSCCLLVTATSLFTSFFISNSILGITLGLLSKFTFSRLKVA